MPEPISPTGADDAVDEPVDLGRLLLEINQEVLAKRASGELSPEFERRLDDAFAEVAPPGAVAADLSTLVAKLESSVIDLNPPIASMRPGGSQVKLAISRAIGWELRYIATQITSLVHGLTRVSRVLAEQFDDLALRTASLERDAPVRAEASLVDVGVGARLVTATRAQRSALPPGPWLDLATSFLAETSGRVLHAECGDAALVERLQGAGLDAYGVDPDEGVALRATERVLDVRADDVRAHLRLLPVGSLGGLVLSGCVDRATPGSLIELADLAMAALAPNGRLVVISRHPDAQRTTQETVLADLAPGGPWHPETWQQVLAAKGFQDVAVQLGPESEDQLKRISGSSIGAREVSNLVDRLNSLLFPPRAFALTARR